MVRLSKERLLQIFIHSVEQSGWIINFISPPQSYPFHLLLNHGEECEAILLYIWNITHGGGNRPANEYRIQITSGVNRFSVLPNTKTLILGYWETNDVFAGWDVNYHRGRLGGSPSFQIREDCLQQALIDSIATCLKENGEIAVAIEPSAITNYIVNYNDLHNSQTVIDQQVISDITNNQGFIRNEILEGLPHERQRVAREVARYYRLSCFRRRVLTAYRDTCAMCGMQLELVDAAHIVPVRHPSSTDETRNGICLCSLHHRAFDAGLIAVMPDYNVRMNNERLSNLRENNLVGGESRFIKNLRHRILLPAETTLRPSPDLIEISLSARNINVEQLRVVTHI